MDKITANKNKKSDSRAIMLRSILAEVRLLRDEVSLLVPSEDVNDYAHAARIKKSYAKALKQNPPAAKWK